MYCTHCGKEVNAVDRFCAQCGAAQHHSATPPAARQLVRPHAGRKVAGVALGFAQYLDLDVSLIRILWILLAFFSGGLVLFAYFIAWIVMPEEPYPSAVTIQAPSMQR